MAHLIQPPFGQIPQMGKGPGNAENEKRECIGNMEETGMAAGLLYTYYLHIYRVQPA